MDTAIIPVETELIPGSYDSNTLLPIISSIIILIFFIYLSYSVILGMFQSQQRKSNLTFFCDPGLCAIDTSTGEKFCPDDITGTQQYNPSTQVCSNKYGCSSPAYRYAILSDGSTDIFGNCEEGVACRCTNTPKCSRYITSVFQTLSGNPYTGISGTQFNQVAPSIGNNTIDGPSITSTTNTFCKIPRTWLFQSTPGCATIPPGLDSVSSTKTCFNSNPCLYGTPAFVTDDPDSFTLNDLDRIPVACVQGTPCMDNSSDYFNVSIYDTNLGGIVCKNLKI